MLISPHKRPSPVTDNAATAPVETYMIPAPVLLAATPAAFAPVIIGHVTPVPVDAPDTMNTYVAPVIEYIAPARDAPSFDSHFPPTLNLISLVW